MKTLKNISFFALLFSLLFVVRCGNDDDPVTLGSLTGTVTYPNSSGTQIPAVDATVRLMGTSGAMIAITDDEGKYSFSNLNAGDYDLGASFFIQPAANARLDGLNFATDGDVNVTVGSTGITKDLTMISTGQGSTVEAMEVNYSWNGSAYANTGAWTYDATHSPVAFEFAYRGHDSDFIGAFSQLSKFVVNFDPNNLAGSSIDVEIDVTSFDTRSPGGRDPRTTVADNPPFNPTTQFTEYGCIINTTFGITADNATPTDAAPQTITNDPDRYATFKSTSIINYGDGYLAKGNVVFHGATVPIDLWFKAMTPFPVAVSAGQCASLVRSYSGFEGKFLMDAKNDFDIQSSSLEDAICRIQISIVMYKCN